MKPETLNLHPGTMNKTNLFIAGAAKCGTTSLYHYLEGHPEIDMASVKEPNYFTWAQIEEQGMYYKGEKYIKSEIAYANLFDSGESTKIRGEASVSYLFYPGTAERINLYNPDSRIIILIRNPAKRAFSHYLMDKRLGFVKKSLDEIFKDPESNRLHYQQYIELGLYYEQIKRYLQVFGSDRVKIYLSSELHTDRKRVLQEIFTFLDVNPDVNIDIDSQHNTSGEGKTALIRVLYKFRVLRKIIGVLLPKGMKEKAKNSAFKQSSEKMNPITYSQLRDFYKPDIVKLEKLIGKSLSEWYE